MARHKNRFWHATNPEKSSRADIRCTRPQIALRVLVVSIGIQGLQRFGGRENSFVLAHQKCARCLFYTYLATNGIGLTNMTYRVKNEEKKVRNEEYMIVYMINV